MAELESLDLVRFYYIILYLQILSPLFYANKEIFSMGTTELQASVVKQ